MRAQVTTGNRAAAADLHTPQHVPGQPGGWRRALLRPGRAWALAVAAGYLAQVLIRLPFLAERRGPLIIADEIGYLVNARVLSGGPSAYLPFVATYRNAGYAALVAPMYWISDDPQTIYRMALVENVLLSALCFPLLVLLLRYAASVPRYVAYIAAFAGSLYPTLVLSTQFVWTENLLPPLMIAYLLGVALLLRSNGRHPVGWGIAVAALSAWLYATHDRMVPTLVVTPIVIGLAWYRRRLRLRDAAAILVVLAVLVAAAVAVNQWLGRLSYGGIGPDAGSVTAKLTLGGVEQTALVTLGQWWVLLASSLGLAAIGLVAALDRSGQAIKRIVSGRRQSSADLISLVLVIWTVAISLLVAASFPEHLSGVTYYVYGRYLEPAAPVLIAVGAVLVMTKRTRAVHVVSATAIVCGAALAILQAAGSRVFTGAVVNDNALGLTFLAQGTHLELSTVTGITVLGIVGFATLGRLRGTAVLAIAATCAVYLVSATYRSNRTSGNANKQLVDASATLDRVPAIRSAHRIGIDVQRTSRSQHDARVAAATYQFYVTRQRLTPVRSSVPPGVDVVVAPADWPLAHATHARSVWTDPSSLGWHVWVLPGAV